jgi:N-methylhydantoinase A/oxoprolinase/acetone carboxylase beta subunit
MNTSRGRLRLSADVGGTFTDVAAFDDTTGHLRLGKTLTTPSRLVTGIETGVTKAGAGFSAAQLFLHGTTVAINTILERTGASCALITTQGFRDIYEIGRVNRPESYNLFFQKHTPLIDRDLRFEIRERMDAQGRVLIPLDEDEVRTVAAAAVARGVKAIAILFLHSYRNADHEKRAKRVVEEAYPDLFVTASHELSQEYREYERTSTTAANAYVGPRVRSYLGEMDGHLKETGFEGNFLVVQSTGGLFDLEEARSSCIRMLESGPAAGVIGARTLCANIGLRNAIAFDMGGTTAKAGVIYDGEVLMTGGQLVGGYATGLPLQIPMIDIQEVGTGGGSIARIETGGGLRVGPESAGAQPGPVCYGQGGAEPTVTDCNLADLRRDLVNTWFKPLETATFDDLEALFTAMEKTGAADLARSRDMIVEMRTERGADMRYVGQEHAVTVHLPQSLFEARDRAGIKARFDAVHETRYGYSAPGEKAEIVSLRSATIGLMRKPALEPVGAASDDAQAAFSGKRPVYFAATGMVETPTYDRGRLKAGNRIEGPALIEEHASTTVVEPRDVLKVDAFGNLHIEVWRA